jgi:hypothetical protein
MLIMKNYWNSKVARICLSVVVILIVAILSNYFSSRTIAKRNIKDYLSRNVNDFSFYEPVEYGDLHPEYGLFGYNFRDSIQYSNKMWGFEQNENAPHLIYKNNLYYLKTPAGEMKIADDDSKMYYFEDPYGNLGVWVRIKSRMKRRVNYDQCISEGTKRVELLVKEHKKEFEKQKRTKSGKLGSNRTDFSDYDFWLMSKGANFSAEDECGKEYYESNPYMKFDKLLILLGDKLSSIEQSKIIKPSLSYTLYHTFRIKNAEGNKVLLKRTFNLNENLEVTSSISR